MRSPPLYPAIEMLRRLGDVPSGDPIRVAAICEARGRDCLREAQWHAHIGHDATADTYYRAYKSDMEQARKTLAAALLNAPEVAA